MLNSQRRCSAATIKHRCKSGLFQTLLFIGTTTMLISECTAAIGSFQLLEKVSRSDYFTSVSTTSGPRSMAPFETTDSLEYQNKLIITTQGRVRHLLNNSSFTNKNSFAFTSCWKRCDSAHSGVCSCKESCVIFKTCCIDYAFECLNSSHSHFDVEDKFSWIRDRDIQCYNHNVLVVSCPGNKGRLPLPSVSDVNDNSTDQYRFCSREDEYMINPIEWIRLSTQNALFAATLSENLLSLLSTVAIEDVSTGISYANARVFDCNGAPWSSAKPWGLAMDFSSASGPSSNISTYLDDISLESLLSALETRTARSLKADLDNPCNDDPEVVRKCPRDYQRGPITDACERTALFITVYDVKGDPNSIRKFKNPFCLVCHGKQNWLHSMRRLFFQPSHASTRLVFEATDNQLAVKVMGSDEIEQQGFSWSRRICNVENNSRLKLGNTCSLESGWTIECFASDFPDHSPPDNSQRNTFTHTMTLLLPPTRTVLSTLILQTTFQELFPRLQTFLGDHKSIGLHLVPSSLHIHREYLELNSRDFIYGYSFRVTADADFDLVSNQSDLPLADLPDSLWASKLYPFRKANLYFCMVVSPWFTSYQELNELSNYRCWDVPNHYGNILLRNDKVNDTKSEDGVVQYSSHSPQVTKRLTFRLTLILISVLFILR